MALQYKETFLFRPAWEADEGSGCCSAFSFLGSGIGGSGVSGSR